MSDTSPIGFAMSSSLEDTIENVKERIEIKIDPKDFIDILEWIKILEENLNFYKTKYDILESNFNNHTHVDGTIAIKREKENDGYRKTRMNQFNRMDIIIKKLKGKYSIGDPFGKEELNDSNY